MKILYLFRSIAVYGGIERILVNKMNLLSLNYGYNVSLITTDQGAHTIPYTLSDNVHMEDLGICFYKKYNYNPISRVWVSYRMKRRYKRLLRQRLLCIQPDIIVCTTSDNICSILSVKGSIPLVVESHSIFERTIEYGNNMFLRKYRRHCFIKYISRVDCVVTLTNRDAESWRKVNNNVVVIPNFVIKEFDVHSSLNNKNAIFVGRFDYQKDVSTAIKIWSIVRKKHPEWTLNIYGSGDQEGIVRKMAEEQEGIVVHNPSNNIWKCYEDSSFLISTSVFEPFGLVLVEAMASGLPVVAFDCPYGPSSIIENDVSGFLISQHSLYDFSEKIMLLIEAKEKRIMMGMAGQKNAQKFAPDVVLPLWDKLFSDFLNKKNTNNNKLLK
ncbi:Glycosyltransferase involved in cell wall bisynthesis [Xylanibacter ruminicola]|uniref:Glycosyltransferase involved in cell wall bisynthesis n=1 Tax=Xylanibacter ruminicola TaxID=839 RepID=A0A1M7GT13_XYLRU|nr:glycosyltransferase [Xylanibacter ruminicola]SHM19371.1 Glycosyltransferase involved in cell wall bisynthesis [Xylanibacter ruminicola]